MKLLLDECVPKRLKYDFPGFQIETAADSGLRGLKNGELMRAAADKFDVLITVDRRIPFQQNLSFSGIAVVVLIAKPCRYPQLRLLVPKVVETLERIEPGELAIIE